MTSQCTVFWVEVRSDGGHECWKARPLKEYDKEYDYVIAGAGSAGCALAARLAEDPQVRVLLVEAGGSGRSLFAAIPAGNSSARARVNKSRTGRSAPRS